MTWYEAKRTGLSTEQAKLYDQLPTQLLDKNASIPDQLDVLETDGYWLDISNMRWQYRYESQYLILSNLLIRQDSCSICPLFFSSFV